MKRKTPKLSAPVTVQTPIGSATHHLDGTVDLTIDPQKFRDTVVAQHTDLLADIRQAKASGGMGLPLALIDELEALAEQELKKIEALPVPPTSPITIRKRS